MSPRAARPAAAALLGLCGAVGLGASRAEAADRVTKVNVVRPERADAVMMEVATRAWAELSADGVVTALVDPGPALEPAAGVELSGDWSGEGDATLTVATTCRLGETVTELELAAPGLLVRRTVVIARERADPKLLAIRAVEVVHGMLLEAAAVLERQRTPAGVVSATDVESPAAPTPAGPAPEPSRWAVGTGMLLLDSFGGLGAAYGASLRASLRRGDGRRRRRDARRRGLRRRDAQQHGHGIDPPGARGRGGDLPMEAGRATTTARRPGRRALPRRRAVRPRRGPGTDERRLLGGAHQRRGGATAPIVGTVELFVDARLVFAYPHPVLVTATGSTLSAADPSLLLSLGLEKAF